MQRRDFFQKAVAAAGVAVATTAVSRSALAASEA